MKILVVEDDGGIARLISRGLEQAGYTVETTADGAKGLEMARTTTYGLLVLDIMLPGMDGLRVCEELRGGAKPRADSHADGAGRRGRPGAGGWIWARMITCRNRLNSPNSWRAVRALLRRDKVHRTRIIRVADLVIDTAQRIVTRAGREIGLSHREYELLEALAAHEGQVLTREVIQERIWMDDDSFSNTVDVYINMLRKKIDAGSERKLIQTVRGQGYTLRASGLEDAA